MKKFFLHTISIVMMLTMLFTALGVDGYLGHCACKNERYISLFTKTDCCHSQQHHACALSASKLDSEMSLADEDGCCESSFFSLKLDATYLLSSGVAVVKYAMLAIVWIVARLLVLPDLFAPSNNSHFAILSSAPPLLFGRDLVCFIHSFKFDL